MIETSEKNFFDFHDRDLLSWFGDFLGCVLFVFFNEEKGKQRYRKLS